VVFALPRKLPSPHPLPAVVVPFYFPDAIPGMDLESGEKLPKYGQIEMMLHLVRRGMDHTELLSIAAPKPFCLLAGQYDDAASGDAMRRARGYAQNGDRLMLVNHATGHRPPLWALEQGYAFLDRWLKI
ncbi:MAG: hypothetical protein IJW92_03975, partial [Clostridia bacterium]|nr:hypothetical protein [Clostridia bacterium]